MKSRNCRKEQLEESKKNLNKNIVKSEKECEELKKSLEHKNKAFNDEMDKNNNVLNLELNNEKKKNSELV